MCHDRSSRLTRVVRRLRCRARALAGLATFVLAALPFERAHAQIGGGGGPLITITPGDSTFTSPTVSNISITWCSDQPFNDATRQITLDGVDVSASFTTYGTGANGCVYGAHSDGSVTLSTSNDGVHVFEATIEDVNGFFGSGIATYTYRWPGYVPSRYAVAVVRRMDGVEVQPAGASTVAFTIRNDGSRAATYLLAAICRGATSGCSVSPSSVSLDTTAAGRQQTVTAHFTGGSVRGDTGSVTLAARNANTSYPYSADRDSTTTDVTVASQLPNKATLVELVSSADVRRDLCLTVSAGASAAYQCGDLRVVHPLPAVTTRGVRRAPSLIYLSSQGPSSPLVQADVTIPSGHGSAPSQVTASMRDAYNSVVATGSWAGSQWGGAGITRRIALAPSFPDATELRTYTLDITYWWPDQTTTTSSVTGELATVSRNTPLGRGWWVTGVEQLVATPEGGRLWVGGDGSTINYHPAGANLWRATDLDHPDSLVWDGSVYKRRLPNGTEVHFDATLRHVRTKPLVGTSTYISYDASGNLQQIIVPSGGPEGATTVRYVFTPGTSSETITLYSGASTRTTAVNRDAANQVASIVDPDTHGVNFVWTGQLMTRRVDRRGYATDFTYDAGRRLIRHQLASGGVFAEDYAPAETKGLTGTAYAAAQPPDSVYTLIDGPRSDVADLTKIWPSRYGSPTRVRTANGRDTRVTFDVTWPALPKIVQSPTGASTSVWYGSRGLVDSTAVTNLRYIGDRSVTRYQWDARFASPVQITGPTGGVRSFAYNADGTVQWVQVGSNGAARDSVFYSSTGQYTSSTVPGRTERDSVVYDPTLGNPVRVKDRRGFWAVSTRDDLGRRRLDSAQVLSGVWRADSTEYDLADNVIRQVTFGPATSYSTSFSFTAPGIPLGNLSVGAQTLYVTSTYDAEGNLTNLSRWGSPDATFVDTKQTNFTYDGAGRRTSESSAGTGNLQFSYDPAGNLVQRTDDVGSVTSVYDAANRLVRRMTTAVVNPVTNCRFLDPNSYNGACYYSFPLSTGGTSALTINGDTAIFDYDRGGNLVRADNQHARIRRSFSPGGLLLTDTLRVRTLRYADNGSLVPTLDFNSHVYGLGYTYDASGRRASLSHPDAIDPCAGPCVAQQYVYDMSTGRLTQLTDVRGQSVGFAYALDGALQDVTYPGGVTQHTAFDAEGAPSRRWVLGGGVYLINDTLQYDPLGRVVRADGLNTGPNGGSQTILNAYSGLGALSAQEHDVPNSTSTLEEFRTDALGNQYVNQRHNIKLADADNNPAIRGLVFDTYGRVVQDTARSTAQYYDYDNYWYDADGRTRFRYSRTSNALSGINHFRQEAHYYDGLGRLAVFERHVGDLQQQSLQNDPQAIIATYRYDALGRRVLAHTRHQNCTVAGCESVVDRTVWDGDQLLYEIRTRASDAASDGQVESDLDGGTGQYGTTLNAYGRIAYTHAGGIDRPVGAIRLGGTSLVAAFAPQTNWRGQYELATLATGAVLPNAIAWPGQRGTAFLGATVRSTPDEWFGSIITEQADPTGLLYRRARYYDPKTGRFTQPDPIGVAGGLNEYGFASGDPVNYSDPFGLCPENVQPGSRAAILCAWIEAGMMAAGADVGATLGGGSGLLTGPAAVVATPAGAMAGAAIGSGAGLAAGKALTHVLFSKKGDIKQIEDAAKRNKMTDEQRREFGDYLENEKASGRGGSKNDRGDFTWKELMQKARDFLSDW